MLVTTTLEGAAPEEVETDITDKIEGAVNTISGIDELRSTSSEGVSQVVIAFKLDKTDRRRRAGRARQGEQRAARPAARHRRADRQQGRPGRRRRSCSSRCARELPIREVTELADKRVRRQIESITGVGQVTIIGGRARQIHVLHRSDQAARAAT